MPALPSMDLLEVMLFDNGDYQPDCPWKAYEFGEDDLLKGNLNRVGYGNNDDSDV